MALRGSYVVQNADHLTFLIGKKATIVPLYAFILDILQQNDPKVKDALDRNAPAWVQEAAERVGEVVLDMEEKL